MTQEDVSRAAKLRYFNLLCVFWFCFTGVLRAQLLAFPTAEGWGKYTVGGRGGQVYEVTHLHDGGPGSLRAAVEASGPRTVVFRVSGTIALNSALKIRKPYITIAGQTAPGDGICIKNYPLSIDAGEVIIRYLRVRLGDETDTESDAISSRYQKNIILDHVSASWSVDETVSIYHCEKVTVQWCLISESLYHSHHVKGNHGYGGIWGGNYCTYHHNLLAHHSSRNPRFASGCGYTDYRNNVIYNWGYNSAYGGEEKQENSTKYVFSSINMVANTYKPGPATRSGSTQYRIVQPSSRDYLADYGQWYVAENDVNGYPDVLADNWQRGVQPDDNTWTVKHAIRLTEPAPFLAIEQQTASEAYHRVLADAGAVLPCRDRVDRRIVREVTEGTATYGAGSYSQDRGLGTTPSGIIDSQEEVGGWPMLYTQAAPEDRDHDGMPDQWERGHGLDPDNPEDRNESGVDGYTCLENYLNDLAEGSPLEAPSHVTAELIDYNTVALGWQDNSQEETGFWIKRAAGETESFAVIAVVDANGTAYTDAGLEEWTPYRYRVVPFSSPLESGCDCGDVVEIFTLGSTATPLTASRPYPEDHAVNVAIWPTLEWTASMNADRYDIHFGTTNPPPFVISQAEAVLVPGALAWGRTYYWRIDAVNVHGVTEGPVWSFRVRSGR